MLLPYLSYYIGSIEGLTYVERHVSLNDASSRMSK